MRLFLVTFWQMYVSISPGHISGSDDVKFSYTTWKSMHFCLTFDLVVCGRTQFPMYFF